MTILKTDSGNIGKIFKPGASGARQLLISAASILGDYSEASKYYNIGFNFQLESVVVLHSLPGLQKVYPPEIFPEDSDSTKLRKRLKVEDNAQKMGLLFQLSDNYGAAWRDLFLLKLMNYGTSIAQEILPSIGAYDTKRLNPGANFACKLIDMGHGVLTNTEDWITIEIAWAYQLDGFLKNPYRSQLVAVEGQFVPGPYTDPIPVAVTNTATQLVAHQEVPKYLSLYNAGPDAILLKIGGPASSSSYNLVVPPGANYWDFRVGGQEVSAILKSGGNSANLMIAVASEVFSRI
jgi:hypothetical protein